MATWKLPIRFWVVGCFRRFFHAQRGEHKREKRIHELCSNVNTVIKDFVQYLLVFKNNAKPSTLDLFSWYCCSKTFVEVNDSKYKIACWTYFVNADLRVRKEGTFNKEAAEEVLVYGLDDKSGAH